MKNIQIEFLEDDPVGLRRIHENNWRGECFVCARSHIDCALSKEELDTPGVYILVGDSELRENDVRSAMYIGQGDSVRDRLQSHIKNREFWQTAVVFRRQAVDLHAGNIKYLEARLIQLARDAGKSILENGNNPTLVHLSPAEIYNTEEFLRRMVFFLAALGFDFFNPEAPIQNPATEAKSPDVRGPDVPPTLQPTFEKIRQLLTAWSDSTFYSTKTPDYRAKVTIGTDFRVFARLRLQRAGIKIQLKDVCNVLISGDQQITEDLKQKIGEAHRKAHAYLESKA